ncbi:MAG: CxxxxCH/CxxCH domain-containing protein [Pseudomonadota bacterium]
MRIHTPVLSLLAILIAFTGCQDDGLTDGGPEESYECSTCHGSAANPAPPVSVGGEEATSYAGVGAHQLHVTDGAAHKAFDCAACHPTPDADDPLSHVGPLPAEIQFGDLALTGGLSPLWDRQDATCGSVYCHGAGLTLGGGESPTPSWTFADGSHPGNCGGCHGAPPPAPHPQGEDCNACHPGTVGPDGQIDLDGGLHIDGKVDLGAMDCSACHGFPPEAPHVQDTTCTVCHGGTVQADGAINEEGGLHDDGAVQWAPGAESCGKCHGDPPVPPHPSATSHTQCAWCHGGTVQPNGTIDTTTGQHMNGTVESNKLHPEEFSDPTKHGHHFNSDGPVGCTICHGEDLLGGATGTSCDKCHPGFRTHCTFCHGGTDNDTGAPPEAVLGETDTTFAGVGAHSTHLLQNPFTHKVYGCSECHATYTDALDPGHIDGVAALAWGEIATEDDAEPSYADGSCSSVYCHGGAMSGSNGSNTTPSWTTVDGTQATCGSCHALPPSGGHAPVSECGTCHVCVATSDPSIRPEGAAFHINGKVNLEPAGECPAEDEE